MIHADSLTYLRGLPPNTVDAIITDPPSGTGMMIPFGVSEDRHVDFDSPLGKSRYNFASLHSYNMKCREWFDSEVSPVLLEAIRVLKPGGIAVVWAMPRNQHWVSGALERGGASVFDVLQRQRSRQRPKAPLVQGALSTQLVQELEPWVLARKPGETTAQSNYTRWGTGYMRVVSGGVRDSHLVSGFEGNPRNAEHPTSKPVDWMRYLVNLCCPLGGLVLDPFCGSGSTGVAAILTDRQFLGIERAANFVDISQKRLDRAVKDAYNPFSQ